MFWKKKQQPAIFSFDEIAKQKKEAAVRLQQEVDRLERIEVEMYEKIINRAISPSTFPSLVKAYLDVLYAKDRWELRLKDNAINRS